MKPPKKERPLNDLRVTRKSTVHVAQGEGHGWAVSYADLLMVLLSFFILYFNFNENPGEGEDALRQISMALRGEIDPKAIGTGKGGSEKGEYSELASVMKIEGAKITQRPDALVIDLEKSGFESGKYALSPQFRTQIDQVLTALRPMKDQIHVTVVGHADSRPLIPRNSILRDNFDLSAVRALSVLKYMVRNGFPENKASAQAASSFTRDTRSVSFEVRLTKAKAKAEGDGA